MSGALETPVRLAVPPYPDGAAELSDHLLRLNRLLRGAVDRFRQSTEHRNGLGGVAIFDDEVDHFLTTAPDQDHDQAPPDGAPPDGAAADRQRCELRTAASANTELPINLLRQRFQLSDIEVDTLLHCLAAELHPGYGRVFAYLNNDLTRQRPSVALIVDVLGASWPERLTVRRTLGPRSALFRFGLLITSGADQLTAELTAERSVLDFVLDGGAPSRRPEQPPGLDDLFISPAERETIEQTIDYLNRQSEHGLESTIVVISGAPGVGRRTCARAICHHLHRQLAPPTAAMPLAQLIAELPQWLRDARLAAEVPGIYVPRGEEPSPLPLLVDAVVAAGGGLTFMFVEADEAPRLPGLETVKALKIHLGTPKAAVRSRVWRQALRQRGLSCSDELISPIAAIYPFNAGRIHACAREAELHPQHLDQATLAQICRGQTHHHLERLAQPLTSRHGWDDIVLPPDELRRLKEIASAVRNRDRVMQEWGFGRKVSAGPGVNAIFFGPSGTGKTMAASILAGELGIAIYRVDLSRVVSKYIGETERNLEALFDEARRSFALLFFDEAEALFGKRSEVKDAHDRYANIEVAYLLQRMEQFEGIAILATNLRTHMDTAFLRRLQFAVEFPLPTVADRLRIWRQVWPASATLGDDLDLEFIAAHLELAGGHIRNVALTAAYLASEEPSPISMKHLVAATRRELQKLGRSCVPDQFGRYASLFEAS
jgi:DNA replication protein DnaC